MRYYLSSFRVGDYGEELARMVGRGGVLASIPNALDAWPKENTKANRDKNIEEIKELGLGCEELNLTDYFGRRAALKDKLLEFSGVWISGGNTFVLRQAMKLSGFDEVLSELPETFLYAGFSAAVCVLAPDFSPLQIVDDPNVFPYKEMKEPIFKGLGVLDYMILPHYKSNHDESADIDKEVAYCEEHGIVYKTLRDGEVLYGDDIRELNAAK